MFVFFKKTGGERPGGIHLTITTEAFHELRSRVFGWGNDSHSHTDGAAEEGIPVLTQGGRLLLQPVVGHTPYLCLNG